MKNKLLLLAAALSATFTYAQTPISKLPAYNEYPQGGVVPIVINGVTRKIDPILFSINKIDSASVHEDTLFFFKNNSISFFKLLSINKGLQDVAKISNKSSFAITIKSLIVADTTQNIVADSSGSFAAGVIRYAGLIKADSAASFAFGNVDSGSIKASNRGAIATGVTLCSGCLINATGLASFAGGRASYTGSPVNVGNILASGTASLAYGYTSGGTLKATSSGSVAAGYSSGFGTLQSTSPGSAAVVWFKATRQM